MITMVNPQTATQISTTPNPTELINLCTNCACAIIRKTYTNLYFLNMFVYVLKHCTSWSSLTFLSVYPKGKKFKNRYKYIAQVFNLFIDCSYVFNKYGVESIATNPEYRKKKVSKISLVSDINGTDYDCTHIVNGNKRCFSHDIRLVQDTLNNMNLKLPINKVID